MNLEQEIERLQTQVMMLKRDLDKKHRECAELSKQCLVMSERYLVDEYVTNYAVWQAIHDLERRCRHYPTGLEIKVQDREHDIPVQHALKLLNVVGVKIDKNDHFPNVKIIYDRSQNPLFGKN